MLGISDELQIDTGRWKPQTFGFNTEPKGGFTGKYVSLFNMHTTTCFTTCIFSIIHFAAKNIRSTTWTCRNYLNIFKKGCIVHDISQNSMCMWNVTDAHQSASINHNVRKANPLWIGACQNKTKLNQAQNELQAKQCSKMTLERMQKHTEYEIYFLKNNLFPE